MQLTTPAIFLRPEEGNYFARAAVRTNCQDNVLRVMQVEFRCASLPEQLPPEYRRIG
jgi:hypothetical protein